MFKNFYVKDKNNKGFILITCLIITALFMLIGASVATLSYTQNKIARNQKEALKDFYDTESAINYAIDNSDQWLTEEFINSDDAKAVFTPPNTSVKLEIRHIINPEKKVKGLSKAANNLPIQSHTAPPPPDSGFGIKDFEIKRYGITATSANGLKIQAGVWKVFNK
ncbi:MAG: pilus assembly PilX N-terminal domain-containing protein [Deltaproteobacteria bacterium]|nr:pilus assembly PilX N-terminal domain-containing protein [Deltaproteobacteria bacterium]